MSHPNSLDLLSRKEGMCLLEQSMGFVWQAALRAVAVLGVADRLVEGKKSVTQLAEGLMSMATIFIGSCAYYPLVECSTNCPKLNTALVIQHSSCVLSMNFHCVRRCSC